MKTIIDTKYECEVCGNLYHNAETARSCEERPVRESKGVVIGDRVRITRGDGAGLFCEVSEIGVVQPGWGPRTYDHTEFVSGKVIDSFGSRMLTFDSYEVVAVQGKEPSNG